MNEHLHSLLLPSPVEKIRLKMAEEQNIQVYLKREDLIHPYLSGNKFRKLKYNLEEAWKQGKQALLTFGGAFSNHIYAVAAAGKLYNFRTIGLIRGERHHPLNPTLAFAQSCGMTLQYIDRQTYRTKQEAGFLEDLKNTFGDFYLIPEGGSNALAVKGCTEILSEIQQPFDYVCCPCGTGGTLAGLIAGAAGRGQILGFSSLKGGHFLYEDVRQLLKEYAQVTHQAENQLTNWALQLDYHFGGYGKVTPELMGFINEFERVNEIQLEQVYTGKMVFGLQDLIEKGFFKPGSTVIALHTGGLQGRNSMLATAD